MEREGIVDRLHHIFDLPVPCTEDTDTRDPVRVMLSFDRKENKKEFVILTKGTSEKTNQEITSWLEENVHFDEGIYSSPPER